MKFLAATVFFVFATASPVEKVVELLNELKAKIEVDEQAEQQTYDKFACWCEKTTGRKAKNIDEAKATIAATTTTLLTLKGAIATLSSEIADFEGKIAKNEASMKQLTAVRQKENSDYMQEKAEMETAVDALNKAINVLSGAGTGGDVGFLSVAVNVRNAVLKATSLSDMSENKVALIRSFLSNPTEYYDQKATHKSSYSPQSATVQGILKDMYLTFATNLQDTNQEESDKQKHFDALIAQMEEENKFFKNTIVGKEAQKADKVQSEADNEQKLDDTQIALNADGEFFDTTVESCKRKSDEWDERRRLRTEELDGITKALNILSSDEARATFGNATSTRPIDTFGSEGISGAFTQVMQSTKMGVRSMGPREVAYRHLKKAIDTTKSLRLATLAATVQTATEGHFDSVIAVIDTMMGTLKDEAAKDVTQRDWCIAERHNNTKTKQKLEHDIKLLDAGITKLETKKEGLEADIGTTTQLKVELEGAMAEALIDRNAENSGYLAAKADDETAIRLLDQAIEALSAYGKNNLALDQQPSPFALSEDHAPDATFSSSGKFAGASNSIIGLLETIKQQIQNQVNQGDGAETKAQNDYHTLFTESTEAVKGYNATLLSLQSAVTQTDADILQHQNDKQDTEDSKDSVTNYLQTIKPNCDWIMGAFEKRLAARKAEMEGLESAKATLSGAQGGEFGFLQHH